MLYFSDVREELSSIRVCVCVCVRAEICGYSEIPSFLRSMWPNFCSCIHLDFKEEGDDPVHDISVWNRNCCSHSVPDSERS